MNFKNLIDCIDSVHVEVKAKDKFDLFKIASKNIALKINTNADLIYDLLQERELLGSTAIGNGFALPHAKINTIEDILIMLFILSAPIDFDSIDDVPILVVFIVLSPLNKPSIQLKALTYLAKLLKTSNADSFLNKDSQEIILYLRDLEKNG